MTHSFSVRCGLRVAVRSPRHACRLPQLIGFAVASRLWSPHEAQSRWNRGPISVRAMFYAEGGTLDMLIRRPAHGMHLLAPVADGAGGVRRAHCQVPAGLLDLAAVQVLRDVDPTGARRQMGRIVSASELAAARLLPQLRAVIATEDASSVRFAPGRPQGLVRTQHDRTQGAMDRPAWRRGSWRCAARQASAPRRHRAWQTITARNAHSDD